MNDHISLENKNYEMTILGTLVGNASTEIKNIIISKLEDDDFDNSVHKKIFHLISKMSEEKKDINIDTVCIQFFQDKKMEKICSVDYIALLLEKEVNFHHAINVINIIKNNKMKKNTLEIIEDLRKSIISDKEDIFHSIEEKLFKISQYKKRKEFFFLSQIVNNEVKNLKPPDESIENIPFSLGFKELDDLLSGGLRPKTLNIIASRPSVGKTAFSLEIIKRILKERKGVFGAFFSLEMNKEELVERILSSESEICLKKIIKSDMTEKEYIKLSEIKKNIREINLIIDETTDMSIDYIRNRIKYFHKIYGCKIVVIDHLHLISSSEKIKSYSDHVIAISHITKKLKILSRELDIPIILLCQLNREIERIQNDKRPQLYHLRDSGAIEQDADTVIMMYRDEIYNDHNEETGITEIIVSKNRQGKTGTVKLLFQRNIMTFKSTAEEKSFFKKNNDNKNIISDYIIV